MGKLQGLLLAGLLVALSGCTTVAIPPDAVEVTSNALPGATMWAWLDESDPNFTVIHGHFEYAGSTLLHTSQEDPRGPWNLTITNGEGRSIIYDERPSRKAYYEAESYSHKESFQFTWLHDEYERYAQAASAEKVDSSPVPPGNYTVTLQFMVAWQPDDSFEAVLPLRVQ